MKIKLAQICNGQSEMAVHPNAPRVRHKILDGKVTLYQRAGSRRWWAEFSIRGEGQQRRPLKTDSLTLACEAAEAEYLAAKIRKTNGKTAKVRTFEGVAREVMARIRAEVERGEIPSHRLKDIPIIQRYLIPLFAATDISDVDQPRIAKWTHWRREYWFSGPGKDERVISYVRNGRAISKVIAHEAGCG